MNRKMISKIVKASGVSAGEMVLIHFWGEDADKEIANNFIIAVAELGATPVLLPIYEACRQEKDRFEGADNVLLRTGKDCELGFGMNPNVTNLCGYPVLDEKMCGTFHIAVGANHMFGGKNEASDHIDFVGHGTIVL